LGFSRSNIHRAEVLLFTAFSAIVTPITPSQLAALAPVFSEVTAQPPLVLVDLASESRLVS